MFTRLSQLYVTKNIRFKRKYADYTIYTWNRVAINYLKEFGIDEFTASPELSYPQNKTIFSKDKFQVILGGKLALVYTRGCFGHILGCNSCVSHRSKSKIIKNEDKNLNFDIRCEDDYRMLFYQYPILNDYSKIDVCPNTLYRYVTSDETPEEIDRTLTILKGEQYYKNLKKEKYWVNSYECNLIEGRD